MELAPSSLAQWEIKSDGECVTLLLDILDGVTYLHGERIIHRDIKPANILLTRIEPPLWKLTDFGLSKKLEAEALSTSTFCGSEMYLAPEVDGLPHSIYTYAVDLWSIGVVGVEYSCGFGLAAKQVGKKWCTAVHERSKGSRLAAYLTKMLDMTPEKRPSASDMWLKLKEQHGDRGKQRPAEASTLRRVHEERVRSPSSSSDPSREQPRKSKKRLFIDSFGPAANENKLDAGGETSALR